MGKQGFLFALKPIICNEIVCLPWDIRDKIAIGQLLPLVYNSNRIIVERVENGFNIKKRALPDIIVLHHQNNK